MPAAETWRTVGEHDQLTPGKYRAIGNVSGSYNGVTRAAIQAGMRVKLSAQGNRFVSYTDSAPAINAHDNAQGPWVFVVRFDRPDEVPISQAGVDVRGVLLILTAIAAVALGLSLLSSRVEKLVATTGGTIQRTLGPVLSPGTVVLAVLAIFLITRARVRAPA